jgi:hypothetical protein
VGSGSTSSSLDEVVAAHHHLEKGPQFGKVVLAV